MRGPDERYDLAHYPDPIEITCRHFVELVTDYREGALDARTTVLVDEHLAICTGCVTYLEQMDLTRAALAGLADDQPVPAEMRERLLGALRAQRGER